MFLNMSLKQIILELAMKIMAASGITYFAHNIWLNYQATHSITSLIMLAGEILTITLVIIAKPTNTRDFNPIPCLATILASFYFFFISLDSETNIQIIPDSVTAGIAIAGLVWQIYSKIYLGRSFGLLPACRTVVDTGPYKLIRHPIYFGYFVTHMGFLLNNFSLWNVTVLLCLYLLQFLRMIYEENVLCQNEQYREYKQRVKYRFIPFVL